MKIIILTLFLGMSATIAHTPKPQPLKIDHCSPGVCDPDLCGWCPQVPLPKHPK